MLNGRIPDSTSQVRTISFPKVAFLMVSTKDANLERMRARRGLYLGTGSQSGAQGEENGEQRRASHLGARSHATRERN